MPRRCAHIESSRLVYPLSLVHEWWKGLVSSLQSLVAHVNAHAISTTDLICRPGPGVAVVRQVQVPHSTVLGQDN